MNDLLYDRAWIEIDTDNLKHNIREIERHSSPNTKIMAVVKANAYGHGSVEISKALYTCGIRDFAVATLKEAIELRVNNVEGRILILGYTNLNNINLLLKYDLIQTVVDYEYALSINELSLKEKLKTHIKINTGMNRLGESYKNVENIKAMYAMKNIDVLGIFSHLCVSDSDDIYDIGFTEIQINRFDDCLRTLRDFGIDVGKTHIFSSYGFLGHKESKYDFIRIGILMYGIYSAKNPTYTIDTKPVLSLFARVTSIKEIQSHECVSYDKQYVSDHSMSIASVSIGYADGLSRSLSDDGVHVLLNNTLVPIIGRVCMDQFMIDVSNVKNIKHGDIVTIIDHQLPVENLSDQTHTITNDTLSKLSLRIDRIYT